MDVSVLKIIFSMDIFIAKTLLPCTGFAGLRCFWVLLPFVLREASILGRVAPKIERRRECERRRGAEVDPPPGGTILKTEVLKKIMKNLLNYICGTFTIVFFYSTNIIINVPLSIQFSISKTVLWEIFYN